MTPAHWARAQAALVDDRAALLVEHPFLGYLAFKLELVVAESPGWSTFAVDGERLVFDLEFVRRATDDQRRFALAHAVWHCALLHPWRRGGRDGSLWDCAIDHEVNVLLAAERRLPAGTFLLEEAEGEAAEILYERSLRAPSRPPTGDRGPLADRHLDAGEGLPEFARVELQRRWLSHLGEAATRTARLGLAPPTAALERLAAARQPTVPGRDALRQYVLRVAGDQRVWLPPSRRHLWRGQYLPNRRVEALRVVVGVDSSASTATLASQIVAEVEGIARSHPEHELTLIEFDHCVRRVERHGANRPFVGERFGRRGGGGTDLGLVFSEVAQRHLDPSVLVVLTDGLGCAPPAAPPYPVVWALPPGGRPPVPWGCRLIFAPAAGGEGLRVGA